MARPRAAKIWCAHLALCFDAFVNSEAAGLECVSDARAWNAVVDSRSRRVYAGWTGISWRAGSAKRVAVACDNRVHHIAFVARALLALVVGAWHRD